MLGNQNTRVLPKSNQTSRAWCQHARPGPLLARLSVSRSPRLSHSYDAEYRKYENCVFYVAGLFLFTIPVTDESPLACVAEKVRRRCSLGMAWTAGGRHAARDPCQPRGSTPTRHNPAITVLVPKVWCWVVMTEEGRCRCCRNICRCVGYKVVVWKILKVNAT